MFFAALTRLDTLLKTNSVILGGVVSPNAELVVQNHCEENMENVIFVGLGLASTLALPIVIQHMDVDNPHYVTCLLPNEHLDAFRLKECVEKRFNIEIKDIGLGKTPIQVFREQNFLGNSMFDNCSRVLKREASLAYMQKEYPNGARLFIGIGAHEIDRELSIRKNWQKNGYSVEFPLIDRPYITTQSLMTLCQNLFGFIPELYKLGFSHNNCHGACVKAGKKQWLKLLEHFPSVYDEWEKCEREIRLSTGKDVGILRETRKGVKRYITLEEFRLRRDEIKRLPDENETGCTFCEAI